MYFAFFRRMRRPFCVRSCEYIYMISFKYMYTLIFSANNRKFNSTWIKENPWLRYSVSCDGVFCVYCVLFGVKRLEAKEKSFISTPVRDWSIFFLNMCQDIFPHLRNTTGVLMQLSIFCLYCKIQERIPRVLFSVKMML